MKDSLSRLRRLIAAGPIPVACAMGCILSPLRGSCAASAWSRQSGPSGSSLHISVLYTWSAILAIVFASVVGDVLLARAMKQVGDVGALWRRAGLGVVIGRTLGNPYFLFGVVAMSAAFFSLLFALSWGDVSLVAPAAASLTFIGNAVAAKIFLHEHVDRRRWIAAGLVAAGVALLAG
jgi:drug/metabolite transporter (DMT)-like permease